MNWKVYYSDGSTYTGSVEIAPVLEVLLIVERDEKHGRKIVSGGDFYTFHNGRWQSVDYFGMIQYLVRPGLKRVLVGVMTDSDTWNDTVRRARNDPDFPDQTALHSYETKDGFD